MHDMLKKSNYMEYSGSIIELCEDWWEMLRQETVLFDVYVRFPLPFNYYIENLQRRPYKKELEEISGIIDGLRISGWLCREPR